MRKAIFVLIVLLLPTLALAQGTVTVSSVIGQVELKAAGMAQFSPLPATTRLVHAGDQIHTGVGANLILTLPDTSYMVISENSTITIQDYWATGTGRSLVDVLMGTVRFYIQKIGGKPNPYRVQTPTALIAVRGTTFDVATYDPKTTEVSCLEGSVTVESIGVRDREVVLEPGMHTMVRAGAPPAVPVALNESLLKNRVIAVVRKDGDDPVMDGVDTPTLNRLLRDNDRMNRTIDPLQGSRSTTTTDTQRAKPGTLRYPPM
jgi:FecR protein